jgi:predicted metal-dependent peptidase
MMMAITQVSKLDKAKAQIVLDHPFFASILLKRKLTEDNNVPTLAVDARGNIFYNKDFIEGLTVPQVVWGLCHEIGHVIGQHALRRKHRDHRKWNYAGDAWINDMLCDAGVGQRIENTVNMPGSKDKTTETIYDELPQDDGKGKGKGQGQSGGGDGQGDDWDNGLGDDIKYEDLTESEIQEIEATNKVDIAQAAQAAKMRGKLSGKLAEIVADIINVKTPWYEILERYMSDYVSQNQTWLKPNRRHIGAGMYLPSTAREPSMGELVVQIDVSGSISKQELDYYNGHLSRIAKQCNPTKIHVIYTDTDVVKHTVFDQGEEVKLEFYSGGGTHMPAGFDWVAEQGIEPCVFVCLTDGYTDFGDAPDYPVVWCISSKVEAPYGENIHFEME